jgi:plastocyanin
MINKKGVNKLAAVLIGIAIVIAIVSFFYINRGTDIIVPRNTTTSQNQADNITSHNIEISNYAFSPSTLTINKGDRVTWTNKDNVAHTVTSDVGGELSSEGLSNSQTYSHTFNDLGTFSYHCSIHTNMKAEIIVQ